MNCLPLVSTEDYISYVDPLNETIMYFTEIRMLKYSIHLGDEDFE